MVVYVLCDAASVRALLSGYDRRLFGLLASSGGVWDAFRKEFAFSGGAPLVCRNIALIAPCVKVDVNSPDSVSVLGFLDRPWSGLSAASPANPPAPYRPSSLPEDPPQAIFSMPEPPAPEQFTARWQNKLEDELRSRKYSPRTRRLYLYFNCLLCRSAGKPPEDIYAADITRFLASVERDRGYSASSMNLAISAIKFFYSEVMKTGAVTEPRRPRDSGRLPQVLSKDQVGALLACEKNPKHRLLLMLVYSSGLRVSEAVALKKEHIDLSRKVIYVKQGKGRKDRCTLLSDKAAQFLTEYCAFFGIESWLFPGQPPSRPLSIRSAQHIFDKALRRAKIPVKTSIHGLRHTFATHLLESGTDIRYIQSLLGHASLRTTERYTHIARRSLLAIKSPLDSIV